MLTYWTLQNGKPVQTPNEHDALWIHLEAPDENEFARLQQMAGIPAHIMKDVQDADEMPHLDVYDGKQVVFLDIPARLSAVPKNQTRPLCLLLGAGRLYTITSFRFGLPENLKSGHIPQAADENDLLVMVLFSVMASYTKAIKQMENESNWDAGDFKNPPEQSTMFFELLDLQKSLIDFQTSADANRAVLQALQGEYTMQMQPHQQLWMNNLMLEATQISNMCAVFGQVLQATGNVAESIVSNNLNDVMKTLTSLTILFSVPTIITAIYTMNTEIPSQINHMLFPILLSFVVGGLVLLFLKRRRLL